MKVLKIEKVILILNLFCNYSKFLNFFMVMDGVNDG